MLARHDVAMEDGTVVKPIEMTLNEWLACWMIRLKMALRIMNRRQKIANHIVTSISTDEAFGCQLI